MGRELTGAYSFGRAGNIACVLVTHPRAKLEMLTVFRDQREDRWSRQDPQGCLNVVAAG